MVTFYLRRCLVPVSEGISSITVSPNTVTGKMRFIKAYDPENFLRKFLRNMIICIKKETAVGVLSHYLRG